MSTSPPLFRPAREADLPAIITMLADDRLGAARENATLPPIAAYRDAFAAIARDKNQYLAVMERNNEVIGCLQISFIPGLSHKGMWRGQIESVRVSASARGSGLGRQMLEWAIGECRRRGCGAVQLTSNKTRTDALRFYASLGFKASHEGMKLDL